MNIFDQTKCTQTHWNQNSTVSSWRQLTKCSKGFSNSINFPVVKSIKKHDSMDKPGEYFNRKFDNRKAKQMRNCVKTDQIMQMPSNWISTNSNSVPLSEAVKEKIKTSKRRRKMSISTFSKIRKMNTRSLSFLYSISSQSSFPPQRYLSSFSGDLRAHRCNASSVTAGLPLRIKPISSLGPGPIFTTQQTNLTQWSNGPRPQRWELDTNKSLEYSFTQLAHLLAFRKVKMGPSFLCRLLYSPTAYKNVKRIRKMKWEW